jgi:hypothetical protein
MNRLTSLLAGAALALGTVTVLAAPAHAEARVTVRNDRGGDQADSRYQTKLTLDATGFQSVKGGFGGVYVMFGWVRDPGGDSWRPSKGGLTGKDYRYIPDSENAADNRGYLRFVSFPGGSTAGEANAVMSGSGGFRVTMTVPGPEFQSVDREGRLSTVDCRTMTCGVITIGAHGVKNAANETFTPVRFGDVYDEAPSASPSATAEPSAPAAPAASSPAGASTPPKGRAGKPVVTADRATAVAGNALAFTGRGFTPGEQVLAILDDGLAALGPMVAGTSGEVAGVLPLPVDIAPGTHEIRLSGAASGTEVSERFPVSAAREVTADASTEPADDDGALSASRVFLVLAAALFLTALVLLLLRRRRARPTPVEVV